MRIGLRKQCYTQHVFQVEGRGELLDQYYEIADSYIGLDQSLLFEPGSQKLQEKEDAINDIKLTNGEF